MSILLKNTTFIDHQSFEFIPCHVFVSDSLKGKLSILKSVTKELPKADTVIDCSKKFVTRSFACGHHHAYSALATGMPSPKKTPFDFMDTLRYIWWTLDVCLDQELIEISAMATAIACARNGVTFVIDHHSSPKAIKGSLDIIAKAFDKVGIAHLLCYENSDRNGSKGIIEGFQETEDYLSRKQSLIGLHASFTLSDKTLNQAAELMQKYKTGIHIHIAEDSADQRDCVKKYHKRIVDRLEDFGFLSSTKTILGHCLHISEIEREMIAESGVWIAQNTESNLNNKVGFFNSGQIARNVMLGTDGMHSDMMKSAKAAFFVGQNFDTTSYSDTYRRLRNVHRYIDENNFAGDDANNLVVLDYNPHTEFNQQNFLGHFMFSLESKHIQHVIANGKLIVNDRKVVNVSEEDVFVQSRKLSVKLWQRMEKKS